MNNNFLNQTALDYDMDLWEVERIYKLYPRDQFYDKLEEFISERARS